MDDDSWIFGVSFEQAEKIAKEYAKKEGIILGKYEGSGIEDQWIAGTNYSWEAYYPEEEGMIVGLPGHVIVEETCGAVTYAMFM